MRTLKGILLAVVALAAPVCISQAQTTLAVRFPLNDTGPGTTFASDPTGLANGFTLQGQNKAGVNADFRGTLGGGVSGLQVALDLSSNSYFTTVGEGGATGAGPIATAANPALNFGFVLPFTATVWFKAVTNMPATNTTGNWDLGPRIFILGTAGTTDKGVANSVGLFYQQWNCLAYSIGTSEIALPCFTSPTVVNTTFTTNTNTFVVTTNYFTNAYVPTGQWLFYAITYDGGNVATVYSGTDQSAVTTVLATTSTTNVLTAAQVTALGAFNGADALATTPQGVGPGAAGMPDTFLDFSANTAGTLNSILYIGNRPGGARSFDGWINDFRFYSGQASADYVEDIRWSAVAPTGLASTLNGLNQPVLTWNALGSAASYNVYSYTDNITGPPNEIASGLTTTNYTDTSAAAGYTYHYLVAAVDAAGDATTSAYSPPLTVPVSPAPPPSVPVVTATPGNSQVALTWPPSSGAGLSAVDYYTVSASTTTGTEAAIAYVTAPASTYTNTNLVNGVEYFYTVSATSMAGATSANSTEVTGTPSGPPEAPSATLVGAGTKATVSWTDPNPPNILAIDNYIILVSSNGSAYTPVYTTAIGATSYTNTGLTLGSTYSYEVEVNNTNGTGAPSAPTATFTASPQVTILDIAEQTVRGGTFSTTVLDDNNNGSTPQPGGAGNIGFLRVKWISDTLPTDATSCAKTYLRWSFAASPAPDTNSDLTLTWTTAANSSATAMIVWSLDQPYQFSSGVSAATDANTSATFTAPGGTNPAVVWYNAQASDTNYTLPTYVGTFQMFQATNGNTSPYTATPVAFIPNVNAANTSPAAVAVIRAPWGNLIHSNELVLCIGGTNLASSQGANGYRINNNSAALIYNELIGPAAPTMSAFSNLNLSGNQTSSTINFTITDPAGNFTNSSTTANVSADTTGGTTANVSGSGATQQLSVTAGPNAGTASVEVTYTDRYGDLAQQTFTVTVSQPLRISSPAPTNTVGITPVVVPFTVVDTAYAENQLTLTATVDAQSTNVLASAVATNVSGTNWTVTVTPTGSTNGIGFVDLSVTDPGNFTSSTAVTVMVRANAEVVFSDVFNYTGASLLDENGSTFGTPPTVNDGTWNEIGPAGLNLAVTGDTLQLNVNANGDVGYANLLGGPYTPGHGYVIYTTFEANWSAFAGFTWLSLGEFSGVGAFQYAGVGNVPDAAADGGFNVTIVNGPGGAGVSNPETLATGNTYNIATRYDVDRAKATLWINAANEADPTATNITANDIQAPVQISDITLSQNGAAGDATVAVNDLTVSVAVRPKINSISVVGGSVQIIFTAGVNDTPSNFGVSSTANVTVPFSPASPTITSLGGGVFKATLPVSGNTGFYQVNRQPFVFSY